MKPSDLFIELAKLQSGYEAVHNAGLERARQTREALRTRAADAFDSFEACSPVLQ